MGLKEKHRLPEYQTRWRLLCPASLSQREANKCTSLLLVQPPKRASMLLRSTYPSTVSTLNEILCAIPPKAIG